MFVGRRAPKGTAGAAWGARMIYDDRCILDRVAPRQELEGGTEAEREALSHWLEREGIPALRRKVAEARLSTDSAEVIVVEQDGFRLEASPQRSYGYLYLGAWRALP